MQKIKLIQPPPPEKERYFIPSDLPNLYEVFQRTLNKATLTFITTHLGTFTKEDALILIQDLGENPDSVQGDLRHENINECINIPQDHNNFSFEPINIPSVKKLPTIEPEKDIKPNPLDWTFPFKSDPEEDTLDLSYTR